MDYRSIEQRITKALGLQKRPVAVKFMDAQPSGVKKFAGMEPSGCSFWRLAAAGQTFYTVPSDHHNCPIGSYAHNIPLPLDRSKELEQTFGLMVQIGYVKMEEVPGIPCVSRTPAAVVYAPLGDSPVEPDVAIFSGLASQVMLLQEAAQRAGVAAQFPVLGRPTCMALPASMAQGSVVSSGYIGNRVYTGLGDGEMYVVVRAKDLDSIVRELATVISANGELEQFHQSRKCSLASA